MIAGASWLAGDGMTGAAQRWSAGLKPSIEFVLPRLLLALLLAAGWVALEVHAVRMETAQRIAGAAVTVRSQLDELLERVSAAARRLPVADAASGNGRVALAAQMLRLERGLAPAQSLFLYHADGRFVAATLPLLPGERDVSDKPWFRAIATNPEPGALTLIAGVRAPLDGDQGVIIARTLANPSGTFSAVMGTFVGWAALRALLSPASLPPGSEVGVVHGPRGAPVLSFSVGERKTRTWLDSVLAFTGGAPTVSAVTELPGGFVWRAQAGALAGMSVAEERAIRWSAPAVAAAVLALFMACSAVRPKPRLTMKEAARSPRALEPDWLWELDAEGRLVGVGGNAPQRLIAAVGVNFLELVAGDPRSSGLRDAIAHHVAVRDLELVLALPGMPVGAARCILLNGRVVKNTGGYWGTAANVRAVAGQE